MTEIIWIFIFGMIVFALAINVFVVYASIIALMGLMIVIFVIMKGDKDNEFVFGIGVSLFVLACFVLIS